MGGEVMARVNLGVPERQKELEEDLREWAGKARYLNQKQIGEYLGLSDNEAIAERVRGLPYQPAGRQKLFHLRDISKRLYALECGH